MEKEMEKGKEDQAMQDAPITPLKKTKRMDEAPVTPPVTKTQLPYRLRETSVWKSLPTKNRKTTETAGSEFVNVKAFVVHGVLCQRPINNTIQDLKQAGMRGMRGASWLLGETGE